MRARGLGGMTPVWHAGSPGSTPGGSTRSVCVQWSWIAEFDQLSGRLVFVPRPATIECKLITYGAGAGYGWPGRTANAFALTGMWVRIPPPPLTALVVKRISCRASNAVFQVQILAEALWSCGPAVQGASLTRRSTVVRSHPGSLASHGNMRGALCGMWCSGSTRPCEG